MNLSLPEYCMFRLTKDECLRSQIVTLNTTQGKHMKYMPYVFAEQGVAMLFAVLHSKVAVNVSISIMNAFVAMRWIHMLRVGGGLSMFHFGTNCH